jgi:hypothetical protein
MSLSAIDFSTLSIMIVGLAAVALIISLAVGPLISKRRQLEN